MNTELSICPKCGGFLLPKVEPDEKLCGCGSTQVLATDVRLEEASTRIHDAGVKIAEQLAQPHPPISHDHA